MYPTPKGQWKPYNYNARMPNKHGTKTWHWNWFGSSDQTEAPKRPWSCQKRDGSAWKRPNVTITTYGAVHLVTACFV